MAEDGLEPLVLPPLPPKYGIIDVKQPTLQIVVIFEDEKKEPQRVSLCIYQVR